VITTRKRGANTGFSPTLAASLVPVEGSMTAAVIPQLFDPDRPGPSGTLARRLWEPDAAESRPTRAWSSADDMTGL
jgi:hypothetical protein